MRSEQSSSRQWKNSAGIRGWTMYVDVCRMPNFRLPAVELCATAQKHVLVQKPMATNVDTARRMMMVAQKAAIQLGVMSQHLQKAGLPAPFNPYRYNRSAE